MFIQRYTQKICYRILRAQILGIGENCKERSTAWNGSKGE